MTTKNKIDATTITIPIWMWKKIRDFQTEWRNPTLWMTLNRIISEWEKMESEPLETQNNLIGEVEGGKN